MPCSNSAKTRKPLKFAGVPQTRQRFSAISRPKFTILRGHVEEVSMFNSLFPIVDKCLICEDTARQDCAMVPKWRFFASCIFSQPRAQHISDMHCKFTLMPHHVWKYGRHPISDRWDWARKTRRPAWANRTARREFQAGLRGDVGLWLMATWKSRFRLHVCCN